MTPLGAAPDVRPLIRAHRLALVPVVLGALSFALGNLHFAFALLLGAHAGLLLGIYQFLTLLRKSAAQAS